MRGRSLWEVHYLRPLRLQLSGAKNRCQGDRLSCMGVGDGGPMGCGARCTVEEKIEKVRQRRCLPRMRQVYHGLWF